MKRARGPIAAAGFALLLLAGCVSKEVGEIAENVVTLQGGTISELRDRRGSGPFTTYEVAPGGMLKVIERACRKARGLGGRPVTAVFVSERYREVIAKERAVDAKDPDSYSEVFRSAVVAMVDPVPGRPDACRVEIHAMNRGPFHRGAVKWERDLPGWIREALSEGGREEGGVRRIP